MPVGPEGIITFSVKPSGKNLSLIIDKCSDFHDFFFSNDQENELDSDLHDKILICGYHFYKYILHMILFCTEKVKHSHLK